MIGKMSERKIVDEMNEYGSKARGVGGRRRV